MRLGNSLPDTTVRPDPLAQVWKEAPEEWPHKWPKPMEQEEAIAKVRKTQDWPRSWTNLSGSQLYSHMNARANSYLLGQPNTFLAEGHPDRQGGLARKARRARRAQAQEPAPGPGGEGGEEEHFQRPAA